MAIDILWGIPGAGKSYHAVSHYILPALEDGRKVISNIPLNMDELEKSNIYETELYKFLDPEPKSEDHKMPFSRIEDFHDEWRRKIKDEHGNETEQGCLYVIDEAADVIGKNTRPEIKNWFRMHRHYVADVLLLVQDPYLIDNDIRKLVRNRFIVQKNETLSKNCYTLIRKHSYRENKASVDWQKTQRYDKKYFKFYKSYTKSEGVGNEADSYIGKKWHQYWIVRLSILFIILSITQIPRFFSFMNQIFTPPEPVQIEQEQREITQNNLITTDIETGVRTGGSFVFNQIPQVPLEEEKEKCLEPSTYTGFVYVDNFLHLSDLYFNCQETHVLELKHAGWSYEMKQNLFVFTHEEKEKLVVLKRVPKEPPPPPLDARDGLFSRDREREPRDEFFDRFDRDRGAPAGGVSPYRGGNPPGFSGSDRSIEIPEMDIPPLRRPSPPRASDVVGAPIR